MFSGGEDCVIKLCVKWSELLSQESMVSEAVNVHGLDWFLHLDEDPWDLNLTVGFTHNPSAPVSCAIDVRYIIDSMDPNGARYTITRSTHAVYSLKSKELAVYCHKDTIEEHYLNDGWLTVFAKLHIFKPVQFRPVPAHFAYSLSAPAESLYTVAERNGLIYVLSKRSEVSEEIEEWAVQSMRAFDKDSAVTLGIIRVKPDDLIGRSISMESNQIAVTQLDEEEEGEVVRIQLDVIDLNGGVKTRIYTMPEIELDDPDISLDISMREAVMTSKGWMISNRREWDEDNRNRMVCFRFWLLEDEVNLFTELIRSSPHWSHYMQSISYNALYCLISDPGYWRRLIDVFVCDLDHPSVWKQYRMCPPVPRNDDVLMLHAWPEPVLATRVPTDQRNRIFLYRLEFNTTDCLLVPFLALPQGLAVNFDHKNFCFNPDSLLLLDEERSELMFQHLGVPPLKILALLKVQRMLGELMRMDEQQQQQIWTQWKEKLEKIIGRNALAYILNTQSSTCM